MNVRRGVLGLGLIESTGLCGCLNVFERRLSICYWQLGYTIEGLLCYHTSQRPGSKPTGLVARKILGCEMRLVGAGFYDSGTDSSEDLTMKKSRSSPSDNTLRAERYHADCCRLPVEENKAVDGEGRSEGEV